MTMSRGRLAICGWAVCLLVSLAMWAALLILTLAESKPDSMFEDDALLDASQVVVVLNEDDPGWDCHTMGNGVCGKGWER